MPLLLPVYTRKRVLDIPAQTWKSTHVDTLPDMPLKGAPSPTVSDPLGILVVVSDVNDFIDFHVADKILATGFGIRGKTRGFHRNQ